MFMYKNKIPWK